MNEISLFNVPNKRRCFPKEAYRAPREALDEVISLAISLHKSSPLAFSAFALYALFPRMLPRPLPDCCQGSFATTALSRRCSLLMEGQIDLHLREAHEAQAERVSKLVKDTSIPPQPQPSRRQRGPLF